MISTSELTAKYSKYKQMAMEFNMLSDKTVWDLRTKTIDLKNVETELMTLRTLQDIQVKSIEVMKELMDKMSQSHIAAVKSICSAALSQIFDDCLYDIDIDIDATQANKTAEFYLIETFPDGTKTRTPFKKGQEMNIGGGIFATVGILFQIFYIFYNKCEPILFMDEALSQLSNNYLENLFNYLKTVCREKHFKLGIVCQDPRMKELADKCYHVRNGVVRLLNKDEIKLMDNFV